jgi:hypothetical protein
MPARVVRGEINSSISLAGVSIEAENTFRALIVAVDDYGRLEADSLILKAALYPRRTKATPERVRGWVDELAQDGCVLIYRVGKREYLQLTGWEAHRGKTNRAKLSRFPDPPGSSGSLPEPPEISLRESESEKESREGEGVSTPPASAGPSGSASIIDAWDRMKAAAERHERAAGRWILNQPRRRALGAAMREHPDRGEAVGEQLVGGYWAAHRGWNDASKHFNADTLLAAKHRAKYLEAHDGQREPPAQGRFEMPETPEEVNRRISEQIRREEGAVN